MQISERCYIDPETIAAQGRVAVTTLTITDCVAHECVLGQKKAAESKRSCHDSALTIEHLDREAPAPELRVERPRRRQERGPGHREADDVGWPDRPPGAQAGAARPPCH